MSETEPKPEKPYVPRKDRRLSRYEKARERRNAAKAKDARYYNAMFSISGVMIAIVFGIAFMVMYGGTVDVSGMEGVTKPFLFGASQLEIGGIILVAIVGFFMWRRMKR